MQSRYFIKLTLAIVRQSYFYKLCLDIKDLF